MILADTSIWIDHFRAGSEELQDQLRQGKIVTHPFIIGELALGSLKQRVKTLALLDLLPQVRLAQTSEVRAMIKSRRLYNLGLGLIDVHLVASVFLSPPTLIWTRDKSLRTAAERLGISTKLH